MEIRDLGPLLVELDGLPTAIGTGRQAAVLSLLANRVGEPVSPTALIGAVWGQDPPARAGQLLDSVIWRLRKELEPGRAARAEPVVLRREALGYRLDLPADAIDSAQLRAAVPLLRSMRTAGRADRIVDLAANVLALWRGEPCAGVVDTGWLAAARRQLADARLDVAELRVQALLDLGQPEQAVGELEPLLADHGLREPLWALLITGLYRAGRQADALAALTRARTLLSDELGVDPGPELRELQGRILDQDPVLLPRPPVTTPTTGVVRLPRRRGALIGRDEDIARLVGQVVDSPLVTLIGPGGVGKTRLAIEVAQAAGRSFPDGVWFVDLSVISDGALLDAAVAGSLELAGPSGRRPIDVVTDFLADRCALLVLDNCEHLVGAAADTVQEILDRCPRSRVLATSREPLEVAGERTGPVRPLPVDDADATDPAVALFVDRAGVAADLDPNGPGRQLIRRICAAVGGLPLGIELAATQARTFELDEIAAALDRNPAGLVRPGSGPTRQASLLDTVDWGYRLARHDEQILHRRLAVIPGSFGLDVAQALCALPPLRSDQAMSLVGGLVHRSLLTSMRPPRAGGSSVFGQLVPIRAHAAQVLGADERAAVEVARDHWLTARIADAPLDGRPGQVAFQIWLDDNAATVRAALQSSLARGDRAAITVVVALLGYWYERGRLAEAAHWVSLLGDRADVIVRDRVDRALIDAATGTVLAFRHRTEDAGALLRGCLSILASPPPERRDDAAGALVIAAAAAWTGDVWDVAADYADAGLALGSPAELPHLHIVMRAIRAANWTFTGDRNAGIREANQVIRDNQLLGNDLAALFALVTLTVTALVGGDAESALRTSDELLLTHRRMGTLAVGDTIETRASVRAAAGDPAGAVRCLGASAALGRRMGRDWPWHDFTPAVLADLRDRVSPDDFARNWAAGERLGLGDPARFTPEWI